MKQTHPRTRKRTTDKYRRKRLTPPAKFVLVMLFTLFSINASMAQQADSINLGLKDALNYALTTSQDARKAKLDVENSDYQITEYKARALPNISGSFGLNYNPILQKFALPGEFIGKPGETLLVAMGQKWNANAGVNLSQTLFDNSVFIGLKAAQTSKEFYQLNAELTDEQIIENVATTYYRVLIQKQQLSALDTTISNTKKTMDILQSLYDNGLAKKIDLDRVSVNYSNLNSQHTQLINGIQLLQNQLKFLMGMSIQTPLSIDNAELAAIHPAPVTEDDFNPSSRTEIAILNKQKQLLDYQKGSVKSQGIPSLVFNSSYSYQALSNVFPIFHSRQAGANWFNVLTMGVALQVPIFNGHAVRSRIKQAEISIKKTQEDISKTKLAMNLDYENAKTQINNSIITLKSQEKNVGLAEQVYANTQNNYNNGLATLTDLLQSETSLTDAQTNYSQALLDYKIAEIQLIKSEGDLKSLLQ